ncbi:hypothetical protein GW17_00047959 [Ensete ventricosum]|nr:hypothetical protein GW17_00047959 [Ensete ventricosum]RZR78996.1 hypothetical protein BHM03_00004560 [Ensete ventricosum]
MRLNLLWNNQYGGSERGKEGSSAGVISSGGCGRSMAAIEGRRRAAKLVSRLRLQSKRGAAARGRVAAAASSSCEKEVAEITEVRDCCWVGQ